MPMSSRALAVLCIISVIAGCSSISVQHDYDQRADFARYSRYTWHDPPIPATGNARQAIERNTLLDQRIKRAVDAGLAKEGMTRVEENPDLYVMYHTGVEDKVNVTDWGYSYSDRYWGYAGSDISVTNYQEGTLILDFIDAQSKELVWRGIAQKALEDNPTPERIERTINAVVDKLLAKYPPK